MKAKTSISKNDPVEIDRADVAALAALKSNPWHLPVNGLCLEQLLRKGYVRPARGGYLLTPHGSQVLEQEKARPSVGQRPYPDARGLSLPVLQRS